MTLLTAFDAIAIWLKSSTAYTVSNIDIKIKKIREKQFTCKMLKYLKHCLLGKLAEKRVS